MTGQPLAYCQKGHRLAWLVDGETQREIHYYVAAIGLPTNGRSNDSPREVVVPLVNAEAGRREVMCTHNHGSGFKIGELDFLDLIPVINGNQSPLVIKV
jgi:hypothetical protein